jgi:glucosylceramidase
LLALSAPAPATGVPYTYDDMPAGQSDPTLAYFSTTRDNAYIIPTLQQMLAINPAVSIIAKPWSPPAWMKSNDSLNNLGRPGTLLPSNYGGGPPTS